MRSRLWLQKLAPAAAEILALMDGCVCPSDAQQAAAEADLRAVKGWRLRRRVRAFFCVEVARLWDRNNAMSSDELERRWREYHEERLVRDRPGPASRPVVIAFDEFAVAFDPLRSKARERFLVRLGEHRLPYWQRAGSHERRPPGARRQTARRRVRVRSGSRGDPPSPSDDPGPDLARQRRVTSLACATVGSATASSAATAARPSRAAFISLPSPTPVVSVRPTTTCPSPHA
jgi:hypothetical protein